MQEYLTWNGEGYGGDLEYLKQNWNEKDIGQWFL